MEESEDLANVTLLEKSGSVTLNRYKNTKETFYSVDISNNNIGITVFFGRDEETAKTIYKKESYYSKIQNVGLDTLNSIPYINSIYSSDFDNAIILEENILGRRTTLIEYFEKELSRSNELFEENSVEEKEKYIRSTEEIIKSLQKSVSQLEPVYLSISPMDGNYTIASEEIQIKEIIGLCRDIELEIGTKKIIDIIKKSKIVEPIEQEEEEENE